MNILYLTLNAKWYNMIESGEKKEEYREIKPYWQKRLLCCYDPWLRIDGDCRNRGKRGCFDCALAPHQQAAEFDAVRFSYGRTKRTMTFTIRYICIGKGKPEWGAPEEDVFIIKLGNRINDHSTENPHA